MYNVKYVCMYVCMYVYIYIYVYTRNWDLGFLLLQLCKSLSSLELYRVQLLQVEVFLRMYFIGLRTPRVKELLPFGIEMCCLAFFSWWISLSERVARSLLRVISLDQSIGWVNFLRFLASLHTIPKGKHVKLLNC